MRVINQTHTNIRRFVAFIYLIILVFVISLFFHKYDSIVFPSVIITFLMALSIKNAEVLLTSDYDFSHILVQILISAFILMDIIEIKNSYMIPKISFYVVIIAHIISFISLFLLILDICIILKIKNELDNKELTMHFINLV